jgi:hypothetical protein
MTAETPRFLESEETQLAEANTVTFSAQLSAERKAKDLIAAERDAYADALYTIRAELAASNERQCHHGWRGSVPQDGKRITTPCPECGAQSLFIGTGGHLTCARVPSDHSNGCPNPSVENVVNKLRAELAKQHKIFTATLTEVNDRACEFEEQLAAEREREIAKLRQQLTEIHSISEQKVREISDGLWLRYEFGRLCPTLSSFSVAIEQAFREAGVEVTK